MRRKHRERSVGWEDQVEDEGNGKDISDGEEGPLFVPQKRIWREAGQDEEEERSGDQEFWGQEERAASKRKLYSTDFARRFGRVDDDEEGDLGSGSKGRNVREREPREHMRRGGDENVLKDIEDEVKEWVAEYPTCESPLPPTSRNLTTRPSYGRVY